MHVVFWVQEEDQEDLGDLAQAAHSILAIFHCQCSQWLFKKQRAVLKAMKGVVQSFTRAKLRRQAKQWALNVEEFSVVKRTASSKDALAYTYFSYAGGHKKSARQVSELTKAARRCGQALRGDALENLFTLLSIYLHQLLKM